jgi:pentachlorophenol monooxygenase
MRGVGHTLLFYADESAGERDFEALAAIADGLSTDYPGSVAPYAVVSPGARPLDLERVPLIVDARGGFRSAYGARGGSVYLIRPDGYLGYRAATAAREPLVSHVRRVLGAPVR